MLGGSKAPTPSPGERRASRLAQLFFGPKPTGHAAEDAQHIQLRCLGVCCGRGRFMDGSIGMVWLELE